MCGENLQLTPENTKATPLIHVPHTLKMPTKTATANPTSPTQKHMKMIFGLVLIALTLIVFAPFLVDFLVDVDFVVEVEVVGSVKSTPHTFHTLY
jgi:hypothetical protein